MIAPAYLAWLALAAPSQHTRAEPERSGLLDALPGDAVFAVVIEDFATLWERARHTTWSELAADPALAPLWGQLDEHLQRELENDQVTLRGALDALQGVAFYAGSLERDDMESKGLVLRLRPGHPAVESAVRAYLEGAGEPVDLGGRRFYTGRGGYSRSTEVYFSWSEGFAVIDARERENALELAATLARALDSGTGGGGLTARLPVSRPRDGAALEAYLDVDSLIAASVEPVGEQDRRTFEALELDDFGWGALELSLGESGELELDASLELPRSGLWPLLAAHARSAPIRLAGLAPADAIEVSTLGYDVRGASRSIGVWLAMELPDFHEELVRSLGNTSDSAGIDFGREVFGQMSGEFARFLLPLATEEQVSQSGVVASVMLGLLGSPGSAAGSVYLVGVEDVAVVEGLVEKLIDLSGERESVQEETVAGRRVCFFEVPELNLRPSWAFVDDALVVSIYRSGVHSVLQQASREPPPAWLDAERERALLAGGSAFGSSVSDLEGLVQVQLVAPLTALAELSRSSRPHTEGTETRDPSSAPLDTVADALPALIETYVSGSARATISLDGRVLRYGFRTD